MTSEKRASKPAQRSLFADELERPWEVDAREECRVARLVFPSGPPGEFDYKIPEALAAEVEPGKRVRAPLGRGDRPVVGYCVAVEEQPATTRRLKELAACLDARPLLSAPLLRLTEWMARHYLCPWGQVLESVIPAGVRQQAGTRRTTLLHVADDALARAATLKLSRKQAQALRYLADSPEPLEPERLAQAVGMTVAPITALRRKGLLRSETVRLRHFEAEERIVAPEANHTLNADQQRALDLIREAMAARRHETLLLHGITGSGKTEVYIRAIQEVVSYGRQAIVLVPEISLTPQTRQRFLARFGSVALLHSHLTDSERHWHWERIARGEVAVIVGARSAVFAPTPRLGLIVLDEEHEGSFKQETAPRYHARDVALRRALDEQIPLILGSATPSLESYQRARGGEYRLVELPQRVMNRPLPDVVTIDLCAERQDKTSRGAISRRLRTAMEQALGDGGQVILLLNRRGYSTHIQCPQCGHVLRCPHCDIALTLHAEDRLALCHYCDHETPAPNVCGECQSPALRYSGLGTQRLEAELRARFPEYPCLRMDTDSMQGPGSHERALDAFRRGEVRILVGTQMIAKGHDFPEVTLVGVVNADTALHLPDFRAAERTFQLLVQVAGRTGRGDQGGRVLIQTFSPQHPAIQYATRHDYPGFALAELTARREAAFPYPPFSELARFVVRGQAEELVQAFAAHVVERLRAALAPAGDAARVLGPAPAQLARLRGLYRYHAQVQALDRGVLETALRAVVADLEPPDGVQWIVDVDPWDML